MVYLNQAATTFPKPKQVLDAVSDAIANPPQGQFRSSSASEDIFDICRKNLGELFGVKQYQNIVFTAGATAAANALFYGLDFETGKVVVSQTEHNSILRPAMNLTEKISEGIILPCDEKGYLEPDTLENILEENDNQIRAVFINHCSNVTGAIQPIEKLAQVCHKHLAMIIADFSQSAGCIPIDSDSWGIDAFIFAGHKGLYGIQGIGGYYIRPEYSIKPFMYGGTGRDSKIIRYENNYEYEVGTGNGPGVAGLNAGVRFILDTGVENIRFHEQQLMDTLYKRLADMKGINLIAIPKEKRGPVLSFTVEGMNPSDVAYILQNGYGITVRTGLHCAPLIHEALHTKDKGTIRVSVSYFNTKEDVDALIAAMTDITVDL